MFVARFVPRGVMLADPDMSMRFPEPIGALILIDRRPDYAKLPCHVRQIAYTRDPTHNRVMNRIVTLTTIDRPQLIW